MWDFTPFVRLLSPMFGCFGLFSAVLRVFGAMNLIGLGCSLWTESSSVRFLDRLFRDEIFSWFTVSLIYNIICYCFWKKKIKIKGKSNLFWPINITLFTSPSPRLPLFSSLFFLLSRSPSPILANGNRNVPAQTQTQTNATEDDNSTKEGPESDQDQDTRWFNQSGHWSR